MRGFQPLLLTSMVAAGCVLEGSEDPQLLVPEDIDIAWDMSFNAEEDGIAAVIPVDVMLYDAATGEPVVNAEVELQSVESGAAFVMPDEVVPLTLDEAAEAGWWDTRRDRLVSFEPEDLVPTGRIQVRTDGSGLARVYVVADAFPEDEGGNLNPIAILVSTGVTDDTFSLLPR